MSLPSVNAERDLLRVDLPSVATSRAGAADMGAGASAFGDTLRDAQLRQDQDDARTASVARRDAADAGAAASADRRSERQAQAGRLSQWREQGMRTADRLAQAREAQQQRVVSAHAGTQQGAASATQAAADAGRAAADEDSDDTPAGRRTDEAAAPATPEPGLVPPAPLALAGARAAEAAGSQPVDAGVSAAAVTAPISNAAAAPRGTLPPNAAGVADAAGSAHAADAAPPHPACATLAAASAATRDDAAGTAPAAQACASDASPAALGQALSTGPAASSTSNGTAGSEAANSNHATTPALPTPFGDARWPQDFTRHIAVLSRGGSHDVSLTLNPPELGPLQVVLNVSGTDAQASFVSAHHAVREAVEAALPALRERLAESGVTLGQTSVGDGSQGKDRSSAQGGMRDAAPGRARDGGAARGAAVASRVAATRSPAWGANALVDTFA